MRSSLQKTDGVVEVSLIPAFGIGKVKTDGSVDGETLLETINAEDVTATLSG